jgi:glyoxylase-like metal-dependent hydrolase (beta-lactamase superfamily II)
MTAKPAPLSALDLGEVTVTFVPDGKIRVDPRMAYPRGHEAIHADELAVTDEDGMLLLSVGGVLITNGEHRTFIDLGIGDRTISLPGGSREQRDTHIRGGDLLNNLARLGLGPDDIDTVLITHLHADHVGWVTRERDGQRTFGRATYWVSDQEWDFWNQPANAGKPTGPRGQELQVIADARHTLTDGASPAPGITAVATPGHTPGHFSFHISGTARRAFVIGDAAHCPAELLRPDLSWAGDLDPGVAIQIRRRLAGLLPAPDTVLVGPHFPDPVFRQLDPTGSTLRPIAGVSGTSWDWPACSSSTSRPPSTGPAASAATGPPASPTG